LDLNDSLKVDSDLKLFREVLCHVNSSSNVDVELFNHDVSVINSFEITVTRNPNIWIFVMLKTVVWYLIVMCMVGLFGF
jgi:nitrate reductase NapE component